MTVPIGPCPFCGGIGKVAEEPVGRIDIAHIVKCGACGARSPAMLDRDAAVIKWNRRAEIIDLDTACVLVAEGVITAGKGASLAGLGYFAFEGELRKRGIRWKS